MKKEYIKPEMEATELVSDVLMQITSFGINDDAEGVNSETAQLGNRRRGSWGDLWNE